jgi:hypothetical protein
MNTQFGTNEYIIFHAIFAKVDKTAFALASGLIFFLGMFAITALLIIKGATPDIPIGPNLQLLNDYLPGYSLTWFGNVIGSIYLGIIGAIIGFLIASLWNLVHYLYLAIIINRFHLLDDN